MVSSTTLGCVFGDVSIFRKVSINCVVFNQKIFNISYLIPTIINFSGVLHDLLPLISLCEEKTTKVKLQMNEHEISFPVNNNSRLRIYRLRLQLENKK